jgi:hypothetical protein
MSGVLALAAVTAVLEDLINNGLVDHNLGSTLGEVEVTSLAPDRVRPAGKTDSEKSQINLFLYHVSTNPAWRNNDLPSRDRAGNRIANPPLAVDLHYLLIVHGAAEFHTEILLGYALQLLHDNPLITRDAIRKTMSATSPVSGAGVLPPGFPLQSAADLADQIEQVRIVPENLGTDELSRLWTAFQTNFRPTASFMASVVLMQAQKPARLGLPVRERRSVVMPFRTPRIDAVEDSSDPSAPITSGSKIVLRGAQLRGGSTTVRLGEVEWSPSPSQVGDASIAVDLTLPAFADLQPGILGAQVVQNLYLGDPPTLHKGTESNAAAFVLHPVVTVSKSAVTTSVVDGQTLVAATLTVGFSPSVGKSQRVLLFLNELAATGSPAFQSFALPLRVPANPADISDASLDVPVAGVKAGSYLVRVQVDGAESPLVLSPEGRYESPSVVLP